MLKGHKIKIIKIAGHPEKIEIDKILKQLTNLWFVLQLNL